MKKIALISLVLAAACALGAAFAHEPGAVGRARGRSELAGARMFGRLVDDPAVQQQLELSGDQIARLRTIRDQARENIRELRDRTSRARIDLREALRDVEASRQDLEKAAAAVRDSASALSGEVTRALLDARDVLSAEQREKLKALKETLRRERRAVRRGARGTFGRGADAPPLGSDPDDIAQEY